MKELLLLPLGLLIGTVSSMVGLGGGVFYVPLLVLVFGLPMQKAIGVSVLTMTFTTITATIAYAREGRINYKIGLLLDVLDIPGVILGAYMTTFIDSRFLAVIFGFLLIVISIRILKKSGAPAKANAVYEASELTGRVVCLVLVTSFSSGFVAGLLGAGGGTIDESVMLLALNMPITVASATSIFGMMITNCAAAISHITLGNIAPKYAAPLVVGGTLGAKLGPYFSKRCREDVLKKFLSFTFMVIAVRMISTPLIL